MNLILENATIYSPLKIIEEGSLIISSEGLIDYVGKSRQVKEEAIDLQGKILAPGFIDIHVHGGKGIMFGHGDLASEIEKYSMWVAGNGVTGFLCTIAGPDAASTNALIKAYVPILEKGVSGAQALGLHLEGPFLNPEKKGAFNPKWLRPPSRQEAETYLKLGKGWIHQMTLAPELEGAEEIAKLFRAAGVVIALGHSNTDYATASSALKGNFTHVTHTYNAQSGLHHRTPRVVGAILASDNITAELIADTVHVHPAAMKILLRCLGADRIVLITDAMPGAGLPDGIYELVGQKAIVKDGLATLEDGTIAGSTALLNNCVHNMNVYMTIVKGKIVFKKQ
jgi:N-acetylglucosamine-6-phosphate deacetylase